MPEPDETHKPPEEPPVKSLYSKSFVHLMSELKLSVWVSTYQAGKLIVLRCNEEELLDTQARSFLMPMGLAVQKDRFALGTAGVIQEFRRAPQLTADLDPPGHYDAPYVPRTIHATGDIQIHEMGWEEDELWFINTRFSCLCNRSVDHSFQPRWKPSFITELEANDRCHLNGLAMVDGRPRYVTALGETNTGGGWRENKKQGGILIDLQSDEIICRHLSMPHSPRLYDGKLWLLESGNGGIGIVDLKTGRYEQIAQFPGFTRGLEFFGPYAFVGLSLVRETAAFSGLAITDTPIESRACGIWVLDIRTGQIVAFLKFQQIVQEVFSVAVLEGFRHPLVINADPEILGNSYILKEHSAAPDTHETVESRK